MQSCRIERVRDLLWEVHLAVGSRQTPLPQRPLGRDVFDYLARLGLMAKTVDSRLAQRLKDRETLIGSSPRRARKQGIRLRPRVTGAQGATVNAIFTGTNLLGATLNLPAGITVTGTPVITATQINASLAIAAAVVGDVA